MMNEILIIYNMLSFFFFAARRTRFSLPVVLIKGENIAPANYKKKKDDNNKNSINNRKKNLFTVYRLNHYSFVFLRKLLDIYMLI